MTDRIKLKPCPFCGAAPEMKETPNFAACVVYWVECVNSVNCRVGPSGQQTGSPGLAAKLWNTRKGEGVSGDY